MNSKFSVSDLHADEHAMTVAFALLRALSTGDAFVGMYDENDYLRFANAAFRQAFGIAVGQVVTFSDIIVSAGCGTNALRVDASDRVAFIADTQTRRRVNVQSARQRSFPVDFIDDRWFWCTETLLRTDG